MNWYHSEKKRRKKTMLSCSIPVKDIKYMSFLPLHTIFIFSDKLELEVTF
jgi:hypothetical protein